MELERLPNIGPELSRLLTLAGIEDAEALQELGAEQAFLRLRDCDPTACFHKLTALAGATEGVRKTQLTPERRAELRRFFDGLGKNRS